MEPERSLPHSPLTFSILNQLDPVHSFISHFLTIHLILSFHLCLRLPSGLFPSGFPTKSLYITLLALIPSSSHSSRLYRHTVFGRTVFGEQYRSLSSSLYRFLHSFVTSSLVGPNILLSILFSNTLSLRSSLIVSDQVSHPYKTTGKLPHSDQKRIMLGDFKVPRI